MFRVLAVTVAVGTACTAALFVPIHPSILQAVGLPDVDHRSAIREEQPSTVAGLRPSEAKVASENAGRRSLRIARAPAPSLYEADSGERVRALSNVAAARLPQEPNTIALTPVPAVITRGLQKELRRVGCYRGRIDGDWGPASRFAMATFVKTVNAALPTDRPDMVLLSLVRRHDGVACGNFNGNAPHTVHASGAQVQLGAWKTQVTLAKRQPRAAQIARSSKSGKPSQNTTGAPRIVRSNGYNRKVPGFAIMPPAVTIKAPVATAAAPQFDGPRMSLGVAPGVGQEAPPPLVSVTVVPDPKLTAAREAARLKAASARQGYRPASRSSRARKSRRSRPSYRSRRSRKAWRKRVFSAVKLSGN